MEERGPIKDIVQVRGGGGLVKGVLVKIEVDRFDRNVRG